MAPVKRKKTTDKAKEAEPLTIDKVKDLGNQVRESPKYFNNLALLLTEYKKLLVQLQNNADSDVQILTRVISLTLIKVFEHLIVSRQLKLTSFDAEQKEIVRKWLKTKYDDFKDTLVETWKISVDNEGVYSLKIDNLDSLMKLVKIESKHFTKDEPYFSNRTYKLVLENLLVTGDLSEMLSHDATLDNFLVLEFRESYFGKYWDLRYFFFNELKPILEAQQDTQIKQLIFSNTMTILKPQPLYDLKNPEQTMFVNNPPKTVTNMRQFRSTFEKCILDLINLKLLPEQNKATLLILHKRIIPFFNNPTKLMDFLTDSYNLGFSVKDISLSILSLNGLWELMRQYNLEYPDFYTKLYAILTPDLLHLSYRSRFFRLLDVFMSSTHISASIIASFIKRLGRLCLTAPPAGIVCVIPFVYNQLKRHPTCMLLIHCTERPEVDLYDESEPDPAKTNALDSSAWELEAVIHHYHPNVGSLAKIFTQPFNKYSYNMEDFLDWSYTKLLDNELNKKFKGELALEMDNYESLLGENGYLTGYTY
ncbi:hypothetical protein OGAPHI_003987 [Ogataea philodendri]|uniref:CCAAT-binding factor domain-containing protein n=1 Tax=Ogataea philodendri TaxID=1378263 RepID=A0A9P8P6E1_9ASCO|nr:uncharacterized protein OGAPHI_003987 [Ogataea philodendri]KAH3665799.1 hypothetical protein OGAPHI_003987 [Ogataea philodendri]